MSLFNETEDICHRNNNVKTQTEMDNGEYCAEKGTFKLKC